MTAHSERLVRVSAATGLAACVIVIYLAVLPPIETSVPAPTTPSINAFADVSITAKAAIVYDLTTGKILYQKNAETQLPLASLTKLLTLYAALGTLSDNTPVTITKSALLAQGDVADTAFHEGDTFKFSDLARIALAASSNTAAEAIAEAASDHSAIPSAALLASAASALGLEQTYAMNGTGLDENAAVSGAYGSARDIALLANALLKRAPNIAHASIDPSVHATSLTGASYALLNTNPGVRQVPGLLLSKTGYTDLAGGNLVEVFDAGMNHPIAVVVLGSTRAGRFEDVSRLVTATQGQFANLQLTI